MCAALSEPHTLKQRKSKNTSTSDTAQQTRNSLSSAKQKHTIYVLPPMKASTTSDQTQWEKTSTMKSSTFNFLVDTLYEEILMHDHKDELLALIDAQMQDDTKLY